MAIIAKRLAPFGSTIFAEMTALAESKGAINLSQGFPDFDGPPEIVAAAIEAMKAGHNQYARSRGCPALVQAIAASRQRLYGLSYDPLTEVIVFSGATEGIAASILGLLNEGDEAILFEPFYDSYPACVTLAGATPRYLTLRFPSFAFDRESLERLIGPRTRLIVLNTPHNPTGKVFSVAELQTIAAVCCEHNLLVIADEVYEHLTYDETAHVPIASLPGMRERTLTLSSTGKSFSFTGWKIGWGTGPAALVDAAQAAHQFLTFATATPLQMAMATALANLDGTYLNELRRGYTAKRDYLAAVLGKVGFQVAMPRGTYFIMADFSRVYRGNDKDFVRWLVDRCGVAAIPPSPFYSSDVDEGRHLVRFAFCKRMETLEKAAERLLML
ncbi:MAG: aminotransferase class I/II-fold pyridoxal phosphate-dependent enzyme [Pseudomonadota bacterium]